MRRLLKVVALLLALVGAVVGGYRIAQHGRPLDMPKCYTGPAESLNAPTRAPSDPLRHGILTDLAKAGRLPAEAVLKATRSRR